MPGWLVVVLILLVPYGLVVALWLFFAYSLRETIRRPPGRTRLAAAVRAGVIGLVLATPVAAVWLAHADSVGWLELVDNGGAPAALTDQTCQVVAEDLNLLIGPINVSRDRLHVGICTDGRTVTRIWGPDCQPPNSVLAGGTSLTCQLVNSGTSSARAETAFSVVPFSLPFWHRDAHLEMTVRADGTLGRATGAFGLRHGLILDTGAVGNRTTSRFVVDRPWQLRYRFDCRAAPGGSFQMEMKADQPGSNGVGGFSASSGPPDELSRADTVQMSQAGVYYFLVTSACSWHVTVRD